MSQNSLSTSRDILPMTVANMTFLINRLGDDCGPLQFVRELTQNGLDAIKALPDGKGSVTWDLDWSYFTLLGFRKLACIDSFSEPQVQWVSVEDHTRSPEDMDDRAAKYLRDQNLLMINVDFVVFTDMADRWCSAYAAVPGSVPAIKEVVHEWFEQQLIETVMSALALRATGRWALPELEQLWSETALTSAVLPRWHIDQSIKRNLGMRLGSLRVT